MAKWLPLAVCAVPAGALAQIVPGEQLANAVAQNEARSFAANIVGPPLGGALFGIARALPFVADTGRVGWTLMPALIASLAPALRG